MTKSKKQQKKSRRQGQRSAPKTSQTPPALMLCDMPPELQLHIFHFLPLSNRKNMALVSHHFDDLLRHSLFLGILRDFRDREVVLCLKDAAESYYVVPRIRKDPGPFVIRKFELVLFEDDRGVKGECVHILIYKPVILRPDESYEALDMTVACAKVKIIHVSTDRKAEWKRRDRGRDTMITFKSVEECRKAVIPCSGRIIRQNYECPECGDHRFICPGCGGVSERYAHLPRFPIRCLREYMSPMLTVCISIMQVEQSVWQLFERFALSGLRGVQVCTQGQGYAPQGSFVGKRAGTVL